MTLGDWTFDMSTRFIVSLVVMVLVAKGASAQPFADRLPASTLVYSGWSPQASVGETAAGRMVADARFAAPWRMMLQKWLLPLAMETDGGLDAIAASLPNLLPIAARCPGCFALLDVKSDRGQLSAHAVLVIKLGERRGEFEERFKPIQNQLKERLGDRLQMAKLGSTWLWTKTSRGTAEYTWGYLEDSFVFYFGDGGEKFLPSLSVAGGEASLLHAPGFADATSKLAGDSILTTYVDLRAGVELFRGVLKDSNNDGLRLLSGKWLALAQPIGLDNVSALIEKTSVDAGRFVTRSLLSTKGEPHGLMKDIFQQTIEDAQLKSIPRDTSFAVAARVNLMQFYKAMKAAVVAASDKDGEKAFGDIEDAAAGLGLPINSALEPLGDRWTLYHAASTGGIGFTGVTLIVDVKDGEKLSRTLAVLKQVLIAQFAQEDRGTVLSYEAAGATIQYLDANRSFNIFLPAWAVVNGKLIVALYPQVVEDAVRQMKDEQSVLEQPSFAASRKQAGDGGLLFYLSGGEFVKGVYPLVLPFFVAMHQNFGLDAGEQAAPSAATLLPSLRHFLMYAGTDVVCAKATTEGILVTRSTGNPLLSPLVFADAVPIAVAAALPRLSEPRTRADRAASAEHLRQIGRAIVQYAAANQGKLPADLAVLAKTQVLAAEVFHSPFAGANEAGGYKYLFASGMTTAIGADLVIAYDEEEFKSGDGASVLYVDGHVDWLEHAGVAAAVEKTSQWREQNKGK